MRATHPVTIALSPAGVRVTSVDELGTPRVHAVAVAPGAWTSAWSDQLLPFDAALRECLAQLAIAPGTSVNILYGGPTAFADVLTVEGRGLAAIERAERALCASLPGSALDWRPTCVPLGPGASQPDQPEQSVVLGVADREEVLVALARWARRAGLTPGVIVPAKAVALAHAAQHVLGSSTPETTTTLFLWDHMSVIAQSAAGRLGILRCTDIGYAGFAEAIWRGAVAHAEGLTVDGALVARSYRLLFEVGIPNRHQIVDPDSTLRGDAVLPLMQPVLQRLALETRQTMRLTMDQAALSRACLRLAGTGGTLPGLEQALTAILEFPAERVDRATRRRDDARADLELAGAVEIASIALRSSSEEARALSRHMNRAVALGAAAAVLTLGVLAGLAAGEHSRQTRALDSISAQADELAEWDAEVARATELSRRLQSAEHFIEGTLTPTPRWAAVLSELTRLIRPNVRLTELSASSARAGGGAPELVLRGEILGASGSPDSEEELRQLLASLDTCGLVRRSHLLSSRDGDQPGVARSFDLSLELHAVPAEMSPSFETASSRGASR